MIIENLAIIVAIAKNGAIGRKNQLLWHIPEDLKYFKETTMGHPVVMGWNTWLSLPKRPLPGRLNIVLSYENNCTEGCMLFTSLTECLQFIKQQDTTVFVMGGASIYKQLIEYSKKLYITWIGKICNDADAFFPVEKIQEFTLISSKEVYSPAVETTIQFCIYER